LAHDCFASARSGRDPRTGVKTCTVSLREEALSGKDTAATHDNRGVMLDALDQANEAQGDFQEAIRLNPELGDAYVNLGSILIKKRQLPEALDNINKGLALGMSFPEVGYYDRALAEELLGRFREAYYDYKKVLELEPHFVRAEERLKDFSIIRVPAKPSLSSQPPSYFP
jgi:tetratricopeptide (TPR) repeat protein